MEATGRPPVPESEGDLSSEEHEGERERCGRNPAQHGAAGGAAHPRTSLKGMIVRSEIE